MARSLQWAVVSGFGAVAFLAMLPGACRSVAGLPGGEPYVDASPGSWDGAAPVSPLCQQYCSKVRTSCKASIYTEDESCWNACSVLEEGKPGDIAGNNITCRIHAAERGTPDGCQTASPMSDTMGVCGDRCRNYCYFIQKLCPSFYSSEFSDDQETCEVSCRQVPQTESRIYSVSPPSSEDTLQCRFYHLISAAQKPALHCPHAVGKGACPRPATDMPYEGEGGGGQGGAGQGGAGQGGGGEGGAASDAGKPLDGGPTSDGGKTDGG